MQNTFSIGSSGCTTLSFTVSHSQEVDNSSIATNRISLAHTVMGSLDNRFILINSYSFVNFIFSKYDNILTGISYLNAKYNDITTMSVCAFGL